MSDGYQNTPAIIQEFFSASYDKIGFVRLNEISTGLGDRAIKLLDLVVPLRSDITVSAIVNHDGLESIQLHHVGNVEKPLAIINKNGLVSTFSKRTGRNTKINDDFIKQIYIATQNILNGKESKGLSVRDRHLILSPLWKPGVKEEFADIDVLSATNIFQYVVLLGNPGSGKTTTAKAIALAHFHEFIDTAQTEDVSCLGLWNDPNNLPIYIELKTMVSDEDFPSPEADKPNNEFFKHYLRKNVFKDENVMNYVTERLSNGKVVLILDGLDEIPIPNSIEDALPKRQKQLQNLIRSIRTVYPKIKIIITSRPAGYSGWTLDEFEVIHIRPLSSPEAANLAYSYYIAAGGDEEESRSLTDKLLIEMDRLPIKIREYPLFVCLLASLYRDKKGDFPAKRGGLLKLSLETLLGEWTIRRHAGKTLQEILKCSQEQIVNCLAQISLRALSEIGPYSYTDTPDVPIGMALEGFYDIGDHINPAQILNYIKDQAGIWMSPAPRKLRFVHRLFQEYLAALAISQRNDNITIMTELVTQNPILWTEVSLLFADILSNKELNGELLFFIEQLINEADSSQDPSSIITLVASIIIDENLHILCSAKKPYASIQSCKNKLVEYLSQDNFIIDGKKRNLIGLALNELGDPRPGVSIDANKIPDFCWETIPSGSFLMGTNDTEQAAIDSIDKNKSWNLDREYPQHLVQIQSFEISRYPVTHIQFQAFILAEDGYQNERWWTKDGIIWKNSNCPPNTELPDNCPQNCVTWYEALAFCNWYSYKTNQNVRLPTEAEWEYVARGTNNQKQFIWGNEPDINKANVRDTGVGTISPVGCFPVTLSENNYQVFDMNGNLWEWCSSIVETNDMKFKYPYKNNDGRENLEGGDQTFRATRGGYYDGEWMYARSCYRGRDLPSLRAERQGFRVVKSFE